MADLYNNPIGLRRKQPPAIVPDNTNPAMNGIYAGFPLSPDITGTIQNSQGIRPIYGQGNASASGDIAQGQFANALENQTAQWRQQGEGQPMPEAIIGGQDVIPGGLPYEQFAPKLAEINRINNISKEANVYGANGKVIGTQQVPDYETQMKARQIEAGNLNKASDTQLYATLISSNNPDERQKAADMLAFRRAQAPEVSNTTRAGQEARQSVNLEYQPKLTKAQNEAKGVITPAELKKTAKTQTSNVLGELKNLYLDLNKMGGIANTENDALTNIGARIGASDIGQAVGIATGTKTQEARNKINSMRPLLINFIRQASNMGARGLDSEKELEFYLQAATNPKVDIQTNLNALKVLDKAYGLGIMNTDMNRANPIQTQQNNNAPTNTPNNRTVIQRGTYQGKRVIKYSDGSIEYGE